MPSFITFSPSNYSFVVNTTTNNDAGPYDIQVVFSNGTDAKTSGFTLTVIAVDYCTVD